MPYRNGKIVNWKLKVKGLRNLLNTDETDEEAQRVSKEIFKLLTNSVYKRYFENFDQLVDFNIYVETTEELNSLLDELYDYCDDNLIWIDFD